MLAKPETLWASLRPKTSFPRPSFVIPAQAGTQGRGTRSFPSFMVGPSTGTASRYENRLQHPSFVIPARAGI